MQSIIRSMKSQRKSRKAKSLRAARGGSRSETTSKDGLQKVVIWKSPRAIMPPQWKTEMRYIVDYLFGAPASNLDSLRFTSNAYDVDPSLGSTAMAGFTELGTLYQRFRTLAIGYRFCLINKENFPVSIIHGLSAVPIAAGSLGMNYAENPLFSTSIVGAANGNSAKIVSRAPVPVTQIVGTNQPLVDDTYTGSTTSNTMPTVGYVYSYVGISANGLAGGFVNSVIVQVEIILHVQFYRPNFLTT